VACQNVAPKEEGFTLSPETLRNRQLQTRIFETNDEMQVLTASAALLQDLGFTINKSEVKCGVIVASRYRDLRPNYGVILLKDFIKEPYNTHQKVIASLVTRPLDDRRTAVRVTFQHMVWRSDKRMAKNEQINEPEIYRQFFSKLSKSLFLTAHEI
jgi:hypothetical protein